LAEEDPQIVEGFRKFRLRREGLLVELVGLLVLLALEESIAQVVERIGEIGPDLERGSEAGDGARDVSALGQERPQAVARLGVIRLDARARSKACRASAGCPAFMDSVPRL